MAEFIDYKKNPGYWFLIEMSIAEEVCKNPLKFSAQHMDYGLNDLDLLEAFDYGLAIHSMFPQRPVRTTRFK